MNYWAIALIICTIALVVGPVVMMQPSQRDRKLSQLRLAAAEKGLRVRLATFNGPSGKQSLAVYSLALLSVETQRQEWTIQRQAFAHELHFEPQWDWMDKQHPAAKPLHSILHQYLSSLDQSIMAIEMTQTSIGVYWTEKNIEVAQIESLLVSLRDQLSYL
jgi:hypothetical protein